MKWLSKAQKPVEVPSYSKASIVIIAKYASFQS